MAKVAKPKKTSTAKKPAAKKTSKPAKAVKQAAPAVSGVAVSEAFTQSQILAHIANTTELTKKQVSGVFEELANLAERHLKKRGVGEFVIPGLAKCKVTRKPATKARKGVNPFTGEEMMFKAKPARNVVKIKALKKLKDMVE